MKWAVLLIQVFKYFVPYVGILLGHFIKVVFCQKCSPLLLGFQSSPLSLSLQILKEGFLIGECLAGVGGVVTAAADGEEADVRLLIKCCGKGDIVFLIAYRLIVGGVNYQGRTVGMPQDRYGIDRRV